MEMEFAAEKCVEKRGECSVTVGNSLCFTGHTKSLPHFFNTQAGFLHQKCR